MSEIGLRRISAQRIAHDGNRGAGEVVAAMAAVQAQDYLACKWAIGLRVAGATEATIDRALASGEILRTHAMRGTWQLIAPEDVRWIVALVAPGLAKRFERRHRELELDAATIAKSNAVIAKALRDGEHRTRADLAAVLTRAKISPAGQRMPHLLGCAELAGLICSGVPRGKQVTWALVDERAPGARTMARVDAIAELARRYVRTRGPATVADFTWWSGLSAADARAGFEAAQDVTPEPIRAAPRGHLLPGFDELLVAYRDRDDLIDPRHVARLNAGGGLLHPAVVQDGRVIGTWRRTLGKQVVIDVELFARGDAGVIRDAAARYAAFLGREADVRITPPRGRAPGGTPRAAGRRTPRASGPPARTARR